MGQLSHDLIIPLPAPLKLQCCSTKVRVIELEPYRRTRQLCNHSRLYNLTVVVPSSSIQVWWLPTNSVNSVFSETISFNPIPSTTESLSQKGPALCSHTELHLWVKHCAVTHSAEQFRPAVATSLAAW